MIGLFDAEFIRLIQRMVIERYKYIRFNACLLTKVEDMTKSLCTPSLITQNKNIQTRNGLCPRGTVCSNDSECNGVFLLEDSSLDIFLDRFSSLSCLEESRRENFKNTREFVIPRVLSFT